MADREETLSDWLEEHGVERDWLVAPPLAAAGGDVAWCEAVVAVLGEGDALESGLEWVASALAMNDLLAEVKDATGRISELVAAVRSYSQLDRASLQPTDVTEGLESTLVMFGHKLGDGVEVVRDYAADVPRIEAMAGELNQVWTNLIDNAVDAMNGHGTLRVSTRVDDARLGGGAGRRHRPGDVGRGPHRAFEPFYTTKEVGRGTGLGLDISRRIVVERHAGEISIDSQPGATVLRVRLPQRHATRPAG